MPTTHCRLRLSEPGGGWRCVLDGHGCPPGAVRPPARCPRYAPSDVRCPACAAQGPGANLLADATDAWAHAATGGETRYACPACGYTAGAGRLARDLLESGARLGPDPGRGEGGPEPGPQR